jgi:hypothetical protein
MVFNATFNNISVMSWQSVLLEEETGGPRGAAPRPLAVKGAVDGCYVRINLPATFQFSPATSKSIDIPELAPGRWFSLGPPVSSSNKTDCHDITEILLKVALNTIKFC